MNKRWVLSVLFAAGMGVTTGYASTPVTVQVYLTVASAQSIGQIAFQDSPYGLMIKPHLQGLPPGIHGFHVHVNPDCGDHGLKAGGHLDPTDTGKHLGPYDPNGHLGDLPVLIVDAQGHADLPLLAPRLKTQQLLGHAIMIHAGGDNYSDTPSKLGGGGARLACGVIKLPSIAGEPSA